MVGFIDPATSTVLSPIPLCAPRPFWGRAQAQAGRLRSRISIGRIGAVGSIRKRSPDMDADGIDAVFLYRAWGLFSGGHS